MKSILTIMIFIGFLPLYAESFTVQKPKRIKKASKQELLEEIGSFHAEVPKDLATMFEELADIQKECAKLQKTSIKNALEVVRGEYLPKASQEELAAQRDAAQKKYKELQRIGEGVKTLKRELKKVGD